MIARGISRSDLRLAAAPPRANNGICLVGKRAVRAHVAYPVCHARPGFGRVRPYHAAGPRLAFDSVLRDAICVSGTSATDTVCTR